MAALRRAAPQNNAEAGEQQATGQAGSLRTF